MNPSILRQFWSLVESSQATLLLQLDDLSLSSWLLDQLATEMPLNGNEEIVINCYIQNKLTLVRDLAQARLGSC